MLERAIILGLSSLLGLSAAAALGSAAQAAQVEVKLVNQGSDGIMAFEPPLTKIKVGDSVKFVASDQGHSAESIEGMAPDGAKPFKGEIGQNVTETFDKEGVYGVRCSPHYVIGMVGLIAVGDTYPNLAAAKGAPTNPEAKKRLDADFAKLGK